MLPARVAEELRLARERLGLSQRDLAAMVGMGNSHVSEYENGNRGLTWRMMVQIAWALGLSLDELAKLELEAESGGGETRDEISG